MTGQSRRVLGCLLGAAILVLTATPGGAQQYPIMAENNGGQYGRQPDGPGPEAFASCNGKSEGASCSFAGMRGETVTGTCSRPRAQSSMQDQQSSQLVCCPPRGMR